MQYTLSMARNELGDANNAFGQTDLTKAINKAIDALSGMKAWECLRKVLRFSSVGPCFTLPQGCAGLVRVCVNGRPTTVRGQDFRFIQSGPGDTSVRKPPPGFVPMNVVDLGKSPIMVEPMAEFKVFAYKDDGTAPGLSIRGIDINGRDVRLSISSSDMYSWPVYDASGTKTSGTAIEDAVPSAVKFMSITEVTLSGTDTATSNVTLYAADLADTSNRYAISQYHPKIAVPRFRRYEIPGVRPGQPVELLTEVTLDPVPLVHDNDVLPFDGLEVVEWMIRSDWAMKAGENTQAEKYRTSAAQWLQSKEIKDETIQTQFIINSVMVGSPGEISAEAANI